VTDKTIVASVVQKAVDKFGKIDILVNNAGISMPEGPAEPEKFEERQKRGQATIEQLMAGKPGISLYDESGWDKILQTNLKSVLVFSRAVAETMIKNHKGCIVNLSSTTAYSKGGEAFSPYSISKRGIVMITEGLAVDLAKHNIRVNAIAPGGIETEMMRDIWARPELLAWIEPRMLLSGKLIKPVECAYLILFLVSDLSRYITGQTVIIDAGFTLAR
jgi:NAD(P)-dependent dehydrogenase (short-subunit alcohol dehydrogenase family)